MSVLTEEDIRKKLAHYKPGQDKTFLISKKDILTPSAKSFLLEKNMVIGYLDEKNDSTEETSPKEQVFDTLFGGKLADKPEHMTHLRGNTLVFKDHPRIILRGKIDSLEAELLCVQILCQKLHYKDIIQDLQEALGFIRLLMRCEVSGERMDQFQLQGLSPDDLRDQSHHPSKYFGMHHVLPHYSMGEIVVALNKLRTLARETELTAYEAFKNQYGQVDRDDLIKAFNRLSSLFWIMMFKFMSGHYKES